ncbi:MAG: hypothetical protein JST54_16635 [Deltaproteobacteria bacterium]|nr:hypothetical protein [Deltaproteobacteria bacterium]
MSGHRPSRRQVLGWAGAGAAYLIMPGCKSSAGPAGTTTPPSTGPTFFTADERAMLANLADVVLPPDEVVGGAGLGTVSFVERLLTALDPANATPTLFVSGPSSGRNPVPDTNGQPSGQNGENDFANLLPLDRVQLASWKLYLYGSDGVDGGGPNDAVLGKVIGLRDQMRSGLQAALATLAKPVGELNVADQAAAFNGLPQDFKDLIVELTLQAAWSAPEYGGNTGGIGWSLVRFEGDVQPYGYSLWDASTQTLIEREGHPVSTPSPGPDPEPLDDDTRALITTAVQLLGGKVFE